MSNNYLAQFVRLECAPDLLSWKVFPNAKEITESMAAFSAVWGHITDDFGNKKIALVSVGDGHTPRTAALFACRTAWKCYSVDPELRPKMWGIKRLVVIPKKIEDSPLDLHAFDMAIIVLVHSHAPMEAVLTNIKAKIRHVVAMPCCVPQTVKNKTYLGYEDFGIYSPKNTIKVWLNI